MCGRFFASPEPLHLGLVDVHLVCTTTTRERERRSEVGSGGDGVGRTRIQRACKLLRETDMLIEVLTEVCGYSNRERFNAAFRSEMGKTPSIYRREFRFANNL